MTLTLDNTIFVSVGAYQRPEVRCYTFIRTAEKQDVPITWLDYGATWQDFNRHKMINLLELCKQKQAEGIEYVFMLDSCDVMFADPVDVILSKANRIYERGTLLFNAEWPDHIYPYRNEQFKSTLKEKGVHLNSGLIVGQIDVFIYIITLALNIMEEIATRQPRPGVAETLVNDPEVGNMLQDDQLTYQVASIYFPEYFRVDSQLELFAWTRRVPDVSLAEWRSRGNAPGQVGQASIIHSSNTLKREANGKQLWETFAFRNQLMDPDPSYQGGQLPLFGGPSPPPYAVVGPPPTGAPSMKIDLQYVEVSVNSFRSRPESLGQLLESWSRRIRPAVFGINGGDPSVDHIAGRVAQLVEQYFPEARIRLIPPGADADGRREL